MNLHLTTLRPRAYTASSRVHAHCMRNSLRNSRPGIPGEQITRPNSRIEVVHVDNPPSRLSDGARTLEGLQADVIMDRSSGEPGRIQSSLSLPYPQLEGQEVRIVDVHHHDDIVEHLDVIDSQIGAVSSLTNAANSIIIPPSSFYSRKPVIVLPSIPFSDREESGRFEDSLDRHVDDVLRRPTKLRRTLMGVWSFLKTPMGIITGIYGFLVVFWGAAIVIFLVKIINFHNANTQGFWVEVSSQVETGLFTVTSIGLIPFRVLDTYRIWKIWRHKRNTIRLREQAGLPQLFDVDDLPDPMYDPNYVHVLTEQEQRDLHDQQSKFQHSQTWYRAHGTETHRAFPINIALLICFLNDGNSLFQIFLCGTMWGLNRFQRPAWSTGILIPASFLCGIGAAVLIWRGGEKTKRVEEVRRRLRSALASENIPDDPISGLGATIDRNHTSIPKINISQNWEVPPDDSSMIEEHMTIRR